MDPSHLVIHGPFWVVFLSRKKSRIIMNYINYNYIFIYLPFWVLISRFSIFITPLGVFNPCVSVLIAGHERTAEFCSAQFWQKRPSLPDGAQRDGSRCASWLEVQLRIWKKVDEDLGMGQKHSKPPYLDLFGVKTHHYIDIIDLLHLITIFGGITIHENEHQLFWAITISEVV